jgi:branched-subunit amino acid aminotransferase/4-amino-4-deoxychorismate lyase
MFGGGFWKMKKPLLIFLDGEWIPSNFVLEKALSPGILKGQGAFETMRAYHGKIFLLDNHLRRLQQGLKILHLKSSYSISRIKALLRQILKENNLRSARVRLAVWQEKGHMRISLVAAPYKPLSRQKYRRGFKVMISSVRLNQTSAKSDLKSIRYENFLKAYQEAVKKNCDEAILLNKKGKIVEGSRTNVCWVKDGKIYTPPLSTGCLSGITRQVVFKIAKKIKFKIAEKNAILADLISADEIFLTNSIIEIMPVTQLDGTLVVHGRPGPVTQKIARAYRASIK